MARGREAGGWGCELEYEGSRAGLSQLVAIALFGVDLDPIPIPLRRENSFS
jgi:hypothetical protein